MTGTTVLRGGLVADGSGSPVVRADVRVRGDRIDAVGELVPTEHDDVIDVAGSIVLPGFIDTHVHAAPALDPTASELHAALLSQGVTSVIIGQDGMGFAPCGVNGSRYAVDYFGGIDGEPPPSLRDGGSIADWLDVYDAGSPVNVAVLVPGGLIRHEVTDGARGPADRAAIAEMRSRLERGLADGAVGLSTGLEYVPGTESDLTELVELNRSIASGSAVHVSHMRGYEARVRNGADEMFAIAAVSGARCHISHLRGPAAVIEELLADGEQRGIDVTFDAYPYLRGSTVLAMKALPPALQVDGPAATLDRLRDRTVRSELTAGHLATAAGELAGYLLAGAMGAGHGADEGLTLGAAADRRGQPLGEYVLDLLVESSLNATCVVPGPDSSSEADYRRLLRHPRHMACSDGIYLGSHPHPRGWGAFARLLARYVRDGADWDWGTAARHLAGHAAERFSLRDRGRIIAGHAADIVVVDPDRIEDRATYGEPRHSAAGVELVLVNGRIAFRDGRVTTGTAGRSLRNGRIT